MYGCKTMARHFDETKFGKGETIYLCPRHDAPLYERERRAFDKLCTRHILEIEGTWSKSDCLQYGFFKGWKTRMYMVNEARRLNFLVGFSFILGVAAATVVNLLLVALVLWFRA